MVQAGEELTLIVEDASLRLDKLLAQRLEGMSRSALQNLISGGFVTAGGKGGGAVGPVGGFPEPA